MKQKTLQFALEWSSRTQEFQVGRQPIPSMGCGNRESLVTNLPTRSRYDQVTVTRWMQQRPWRNVRGRRQQAGNVIGSVPDELAQAGTACTVFSLWSATSATPAKQEWHKKWKIVIDYDFMNFHKNATGWFGLPNKTITHYYYTNYYTCVRSRRTTSVERFADQPPSVWLSLGQFRRALKTHLFDCVCRA